MRTGVGRERAQPWPTGTTPSRLPPQTPMGAPPLTLLTSISQLLTPSRTDLNGNLTNDGRRVFEYDFENQLTNVYVAAAWRSEFKYDAFGRKRVQQDYGWTGSAWLLTNEVRYIYDGMTVVQERNANNLALVSYTRGNDLSGTLQEAGGIGGLLARTDLPHFTRRNPHWRMPIIIVMAMAT